MYMHVYDYSTLVENTGMEQHYKVLSTSGSIIVAWDKQFAEKKISPFKITSYDIKFKEEGTRPFLVKHIKKDDDEIEITDLKSSTVYEINVLWCNEDEESKILFKTTCKTKESKATFLMETATSDKTKKPFIYHLQPVSTIAHSNGIRVLDMIAERIPNIHSSEEKTLLLLGGTGTGKSTFVDALINFIASVSFTDDYRFGLICKTDEERKRADKQFQSQTSSVTVYRIPRMDGLQISCGVNIIDTPGFDDTREDFDKLITSQMKELFERRIDHLDAILVVLPLSTKRLTKGQTHIFSSILEMFGDDVKANIIVTFTHDDLGDEHSCLSLLKAANIPYTDYFRFNNSNILTHFDLLKGKESSCQHIWNTRTENFSKMFKKLETTEKTTITSSIEVMQARINLELQLKSLKEKLSKQAQAIANYKEDVSVLRALKEESKENQAKLRFERIVSETEVEYNTRESLNCPKCQKTCHEKCLVPLNKLKWTCEAIKKSKCTICDGKCDVSDHVLDRNLYKVRFVPKFVSVEDVFNRQKNREATFKLLQETLQRLEELITMINRIALSKNALTVTRYIQNIVDEEKKYKKTGYKNRTQIQENILKHIRNKPISELSIDHLM